ncbi:hypothetical protein E8D34_05490 [Nocardioides sp. GY 10113]|uniref:hypothetical protein n=1 Tax=Nocardioides sp. GY 10113 TaxID=2569761 RepID=UPI0010A8AA09|nr:hypothetical protein [Nocardioides sp. GY 10113]TIC88378.1 hypothetical protein E8D34_05490 [Nocardioides sp. GY 10113]
MKKVIVALLAAVLVSAGLVGAASVPAQASCLPAYPGCPHAGVSWVKAANVVTKAKPFTAKVKVATYGNMPATGPVFVVCKHGESTARSWATVKTKAKKAYPRLRLWRKGMWSCIASYSPAGMAKGTKGFTVRAK